MALCSVCRKDVPDNEAVAYCGRHEGCWVDALPQILLPPAASVLIDYTQAELIALAKIKQQNEADDKQRKRKRA
jgi:hypothetical protein